MRHYKNRQVGLNQGVHLFLLLRLCALLRASLGECESRHCCLDAVHDGHVMESTAGLRQWLDPGWTKAQRTTGRGLHHRLTSYSRATKINGTKLIAHRKHLS